MTRTQLLITFCIGFIISCSNDDNTSQNIFSGTISWAKTFGGSAKDVAISVINTTDGNILILGTTASIDGDIIDKNSQENDYWLTKLDQQGNTLWAKTYGGTDDDVGQEVIELSDGNIAIVGYSKSSDGDASNNEGFHDNWILKLDHSGNILWEKSFGFSGHDHAYSLLETHDGGFFMSGFLDVTSSGGAGSTTRGANRHGVGEFWCHKLDAQGNIEWRKYFGGSSNDRAYGAVQSNDGGYVVTGLSESNDFDITNAYGSYDYWVVKLDANGNMVWETSIGGSEIDQSRAIVTTNDNGYLILGNSFSTDGVITANYGGSDVMITKLNANGAVSWSKNYGGSNFDFGTSIKKASNGYLVTGYTQSIDIDVNENKGDNDFWIFKINEFGNISWQKTFGGSGLDFCHDVIETIDNTIIIVGETESNDFDIPENKGLKDALIIKIN